MYQTTAKVCNMIQYTTSICAAFVPNVLDLQLYIGAILQPYQD